MAAISRINVMLTSSIGGLVSGFKTAGTHVQSFATKVASAGVMAAKAGVAMTGALAAGVTGIGIYALKLAADAETARVSFTTMLGSADKAKQLVGEIQKFAAATPFETTELVDASKKLLAFGVAQEQIIPTMRTLGDIAAGLGIPLGELSELYGKAKVQGRLMAEDINQLTGRGIPVIQEFAKQFGVTEGEVKKLVESGKIGFPELQKAMVAMTGEGGKFAGMMDAQSKTFSGLMSTLRDTVDQNLTKVGETLMDKFDLKGAIGGISIAIQTIADSLIPMIGELAGSFGGTGDSAQTAANIIITGAKWIGHAIAFATNVVDSFRLMFKGVQVAGLWAFKMVLIGATKMAEGIAWTVNKAIEGINWVIKQMNKLPKVNVPEIQMRLGVDPSSKQFIEGIDQTISEIGGDMGDIADNMTNRVDGVGRFFDEVQRKADEARKAQNALGEASKAAAMAIEQGAGQNIAKINEVLAKLRQQVEQFGKTDAMKSMDELTKAGANEQQLAEARQLQDQLAQLEKNKKAQEELADSAKKMFEETRTPAERYAAELEKINELLIKGMIDRETADRAAAKARQDILKSDEPEKKEGPKLLQAGSQEAAQFIAQVQRQGKAESEQKQLVKGQATQTDVLREIATNTKGGGTTLRVVENF